FLTAELLDSDLLLSRGIRSCLISSIMLSSKLSATHCNSSTVWLSVIKQGKPSQICTPFSRKRVNNNSLYGYSSRYLTFHREPKRTMYSGKLYLSHIFSNCSVNN